jgi:hypothetical protein
MGFDAKAKLLCCAQVFVFYMPMLKQAWLLGWRLPAAISNGVRC